MKSGSEKSASASPWQSVWQRFKKDPLAVGALCALVLLMLLALLAPLLANPRALLAYTPGDGLSMPFLRSFFAPESTEFFIEKLFNFALLALLYWFITFALGVLFIAVARILDLLDR